MTSQRKFASNLLFTAVVALVLAPAAHAGPPLICFPFDIGNAKSLPWDFGTGERSWNNPAAGYDIRSLANDTLSLLDGGAPVLVRMETLRRAALYAIRDSFAGDRMLERLKTRSTSSAPATFDYGYFVETMKQAVVVNGARKPGFNLAAVDGYEIIERALAAHRTDPQMEYAASIVSLGPKRTGHEQHLLKAVEGAVGDALLSRNLVSHYSHLGRNLPDIQASLNREGNK